MIQIGHICLSNAVVQMIMNIRSLIKYKITKLSAASRRNTDIKKISSLLMVDLFRIEFCLMRIYHLGSLPLIFLLITGLVVWELNWCGLFAPIIMIVCVMFQTVLNNKFLFYNKEKLERTSQRISKIIEFVKGINIIKFYAWEFLLEKQIKKIRKNEQIWIFLIHMVKGFTEAIFNSYPSIAAMVCIGSYQINYGDISVETTFSIIALFNVAVLPMRGFMSAILNVMTTKIAIKRINHFIGAEEGKDLLDSLELKKGEVCIINGNISWDNPEVKGYFNNKTTVDKDSYSFCKI